MDTNQDWHGRVYMNVEHESGLAHARWRLLRDEILMRDNYTCLRCDKKFRYKKHLSVHHMVSRANGGSNDPSNLVTLCNPCHDYVEIYDLRTRADIIGSLETDVEIIENREQGEEDKPDPYNRPSWHKWVYGGSRNPKLDGDR